MMPARRLRTGTVAGAVAVGAGPATVAAVALPDVALLLCVGLGVVVGALAWTWTRLTSDAPGTAPAVALGAGVATVAGGLALAGLMLLLGPATVAVIPAVYALAGLAFWYRSYARAQSGSLR